MANVQYYDVILKPVVTEKSMELMGEKKYTFLVHPEATKSQIKEAVEKMFTGTKVEKVNTMNNDLQKIAQISRSSRDYKIAKHTDRNRDNKQLKGDLSWELKHTAHIRLPEDR